MIRYTDTEIDLSNKQLIMPSIGYGSAPSLAIDLLIASNGFKRVAFIESKHLQPSVGYLNKNIENGVLGLPAELYVKGEVAILQLRSRTRIGRAREFVQELSIIFKNCLEKGLIIISALPFSLRSDLDIASVSKNIYSYSKGDFPQFKKSIESNQFRPVTDLIDQDQEPIDILENAGLIKFFLKSDKFPIVACISAFSQEMPDISAATFLGKNLVQVLESNEVGLCNAKALE